MQILTFMLVLLLGLSTSSASAVEPHRYIPVQAGSPQGGIIVRYPDVAEPMANQIGQSLADFGWAILLVPENHGVVSETPSPSADDLIDYMATEKGQLNLVLLMIGDTWDKDTTLVAPIPMQNINKDTTLEKITSDHPVRGVILLDVPGEVPVPPELPVLDVVTRNQAPVGWSTRQKQAKLSRANQQNLTLTYSTRRQLNESRLERRVRGWLHHNLKGQEFSEDDL